MISIPILDAAGKQVETLELDPAEFGGAVNKQLLHDAVVMYQANQRAGTHKTKTRAEVAGSGKKLFRQKGTGNARVGTKRTNKRRGGGTAFGPVPRDYSYSMPKKARRLAANMAVLSKLQDNEAVVVSGLSLAQPKTKEMVDVLASLGLEGQTCLVATKGAHKNVYLSGRNIVGVEVLPAEEINAWTVLRRKRLLLTKDALQGLREAAKKSRGEGA